MLRVHCSASGRDGEFLNAAHFFTKLGVFMWRSSDRSVSGAVTIRAFNSLIAAVREQTAPARATVWTRIASR